MTTAARATSPVYLSDADLTGLATFGDAIDVLEVAFAELAQGQARNLVRQRIAGDSSVYNVMAGQCGGGLFGLKAYTVSSKGAPMHVLLYADDGSGLRAMMSGGWMSLLRTGSASGLSARYMAPGSTSAIGVIGSGGQALAQVRGVVAATGAERVQVYSRAPAKRESFAARVAEELKVSTVVCASPAEAAAGAGVVVTITNSPQPVLSSGDVPDGVHIVAAGNNNPARAEIDAALIGRCQRVVVDDLDQAKVECGDLIAAAAAGQLNWERVATLDGVISGTVTGRANDDEVTLFESQGIALEDVAIAGCLYQRAVELGRGTPLT